MTHSEWYCLCKKNYLLKIYLILMRHCLFFCSRVSLMENTIKMRYYKEIDKPNKNNRWWFYEIVLEKQQIQTIKGRMLAKSMTLSDWEKYKTKWFAVSLSLIHHGLRTCQMSNSHNHAPSVSRTMFCFTFPPRIDGYQIVSKSNDQ